MVVLSYLKIAKKSNFSNTTQMPSLLNSWFMNELHMYKFVFTYMEVHLMCAYVHV